MKSLITKIVFATLGILSLLSAEEWSSAAALNTPRAGAAAVSYDGKIYVFGGKSFNNKLLNSVEVYDPLNDVWNDTEVEPFKHARYNASAIVWENKIYLIGGRTNNKAVEMVEVYDPVQNKWQQAHEMHNEREGHSANILNDRIYVIGGRKSSEYVDDIEWYNKMKTEWEEADIDMDDHARAAHFSAVYRNAYYMLGGYYYGGPTNTIYKLNLDSLKGDTWENLGTMSSPRAYGATAAIDSMIFLIGGETTDGKTGMVELFNTQSGRLSTGLSMPSPRSGMAAAVLQSKVFVIGGYSGAANDILDKVEVYTPDITAIITRRPLPQGFRLARAYPNPFNGRIRLDFKIALSGTVQIDILNSIGQKIRRLEERRFSPGNYSTFWDARDNNGTWVASGSYFILIRSGGQHQILKITYVK